MKELSEERSKTGIMDLDSHPSRERKQGGIHPASYQALRQQELGLEGGKRAVKTTQPQQKQHLPRKPGKE